MAAQTIGDFSLDPFQTAEDDLNLQQKLALTRILRQGVAPYGEDISSRTQRNLGVMQGYASLDENTKLRKSLSDKYEASLVNALRNNSADVQAMVSSPATRKEGLMGAAREMNAGITATELERIRKQFLGGGGDSGSGSGDQQYQMAVAMSLSSDPETSKRGKALVELMKPHDPKDSMRVGLTGGASALPGAAGLYDQQQRTKAQYDPQLIANGLGGTMQSNQAQLPQFGGAGNGPLPAPATGSPLGSLPGAAPPSQPNYPASGPPTSAPSALPGAVAASGGLPPYRTTESMKAAVAGLDNEVNSPEEEAARAWADKVGKGFTGGVVPQEVLNQANQGGSAWPIGQAGASALPQSTGRLKPEDFLDPSTRIQQPNAGVGQTNPSAQQIYVKRMEGQAMLLQELQKQQAGAANIRMAVNDIEQANKGKTYSGFPEVGMTANRAATFLGGDTSTAASNTAAITAKANQLGSMFAKELGYNPSNIDLTSAMARVPNADMSPAQRQVIIDQLKRGIAYREESTPFIAQAVAQGYDLSSAQEAFDKFYRQRESQKQNPTGAVSGQALPLTAKAEGGGGVGAFMGDLARNARSLPGAIAAQGIPAMKDSFGNFVEGAKELVGQGDRPAAMKELERQKALMASNPEYAQARAGTDIWGNPTSYLPGSAIPKAMMVGAAQGVTQPGETLGDQLHSGAVGGILGGVGALASKVLPTTALHSSVNREGLGTAALEQFPSFHPTAAQAGGNTFETQIARYLGMDKAAAAGQAASITKDVLATAKMTGDITSEKLASNMTAIGKEFETMFPKGKLVAVTGSDAQALKEAISNTAGVQDLMAKAPKLATIFTILDKPAGTARPKLDAKDLHQAWKEVGEVATDKYAAAETRKVLMGLINKVLPANDQKAFAALNERWGATKDIARVFRDSGGEGVGGSVGQINPSRFNLEAGSGPQSTITDAASSLINRFNLKNPHAPEIGADTAWGTAKDVIGTMTGETLHQLDRGSNRLIAPFTGSALRSPEAVKRAVEALRYGVRRTPENLYQENQ